MAIAHFGVTNLTAIVDYNHLQTDGTTEEVMDTGDVRAKFDAFGWDDRRDRRTRHAGGSSRPWNGAAPASDPAAIVCQTRKGKGVSLMEGPLRLPRQAAHSGAG